MHILLMAATAFEIQPVVNFLHQQASRRKEKDPEHPGSIHGLNRQEAFSFKKHHLHILIGGVGGISTTYSLMDYLRQHTPDYILQAGISGSFSDETPVPSLVCIREELMGDMGAAEKDDFKDIFDLGLLQPDTGIYTNRSLVNPHMDKWTRFDIPFVKSITINEITTQPARIGLLKQKYQPVVESMEGAALHYVCLMKGIPFMQLRAISNKVGERDKTKWKMKEAIALLNEKLVEVIDNFPE